MTMPIRLISCDEGNNLIDDSMTKNMSITYYEVNYIKKWKKKTIYSYNGLHGLCIL